MATAKTIIQKKKLEDDRIWKGINLLMGVGVLLVLFVALNRVTIYLQPLDNIVTNLTNYLSAVGVGLLIGGGFFCAGGLMGFLFGIPRMLQKNDNLFKDNDNLVDVSDWLTKIIVGVGLTQLTELPRHILKIGDKFGICFSTISFKNEGPVTILDDSGKIAAVAIVLFFTILGFFYVYLWTRIFFGAMLKRNELELIEELDQAKEDIEVTEKKLVTAQQENVIKDQQLETVQKDSDTKQQDMNAILQTFSSSANVVRESFKEFRSSEDLETDPQKGKWGGKSENGDRKLTASIRETTFNSHWYNVTLEVTSTNPDNPLIGDVIFHIHPSFPSETEVIAVQDGKAVLQLVSWGAFTVGAECDNSTTHLEIDLGDLQDAPQSFKDI